MTRSGVSFGPRHRPGLHHRLNNYRCSGMALRRSAKRIWRAAGSVGRKAVHMTNTAGVAPRLADALAVVLGTQEIPLRLRAWDGSEAGPEDAPVLEFRSRRALRRILWSPGQLGISRAYVAGEIDAPGDVFASFAALSSAGKFAEPGPFPSAHGAGSMDPAQDCAPGRRDRVRIRSPAGGIEDPTGSAAGTPRAGTPRQYRITTTSATTFTALVLGLSMVYSCAVWNHPASGNGGPDSLESAQEAKIDLVCRKLGLRGRHARA